MTSLCSFCDPLVRSTEEVSRLNLPDILNLNLKTPQDLNAPIPLLIPHWKMQEKQPRKDGSP